MTVIEKAPTWFWIVSILALIWNLMGVLAYIGQVSLSPEALEAMSEMERVAIENRPAWATAAFALAVFGGFLACLFLILKKALSTILFYISFASILVQMYYAFFVIDSIEMFGPAVTVMPSMVIVIGFLLILLSRKAKAKYWIA